MAYRQRVFRLPDIKIEELDSERARTRFDVEGVENTITTWRNAVLAAISFAASIILGLSSVDLFKALVLQILFMDILVGLTVFIAFILIKGKVHGLMLLMDRAHFLAIDKLNLMKSYFIQETYSVDEIEEERIRFFLTYYAFAPQAVRVYIIWVLRSMLSSVFFKKTRLRKLFDYQTIRVNAAMEHYEKMKSSWSRYSSDLRELDPILKDFFNHHGYIMV